MLILSLIGTVATLFICALSIFFSNLYILLLGRFLGGLMAGNMTLAYASLADFSSPEEKVKNFALIPLATGLGFAGGPYLAGILANPDTHALAGPALPFLFATLLALVNLTLVFWKFPETSSQVMILHALTFLVMLTCAVAYTNSMALVSNQANQEQQGEIMGVAVSIQSCAEFLPATILGLIASISQALPLLAAALLAGSAYLILRTATNKVPEKVST